MVQMNGMMGQGMQGMAMPGMGMMGVAGMGINNNYFYFAGNSLSLQSRLDTITD